MPAPAETFILFLSGGYCGRAIRADASATDAKAAIARASLFGRSIMRLSQSQMAYSYRFMSGVRRRVLAKRRITPQVVRSSRLRLATRSTRDIMVALAIIISRDTPSK